MIASFTCNNSSAVGMPNGTRPWAGFLLRHRHGAACETALANIYDHRVQRLALSTPQSMASHLATNRRFFSAQPCAATCTGLRPRPPLTNAAGNLPRGFLITPVSSSRCTCMPTFQTTRNSDLPATSSAARVDFNLLVDWDPLHAAFSDTRSNFVTDHPPAPCSLSPQSRWKTFTDKTVLRTENIFRAFEKSLDRKTPTTNEPQPIKNAIAYFPPNFVFTNRSRLFRRSRHPATTCKAQRSDQTSSNRCFTAWFFRQHIDKDAFRRRSV